MDELLNDAFALWNSENGNSRADIVQTLRDIAQWPVDEPSPQSQSESPYLRDQLWRGDPFGQLVSEVAWLKS